MKNRGFSYRRLNMSRLLLTAFIMISHSFWLIQTNGECLARPIYILAHMQNSIGELNVAFDRGANAVEADVEFHPNGTVLRLFHGVPCDCLRICGLTDHFSTYVERVRNLSSPSHPDFEENFSLIMLDLKCTTLDPAVKYFAGADLAYKLIKHLWEGGNGQSQVWVILYLENFLQSDVIRGFREYFINNGFEDLLYRVGYEIGPDRGNHANDALNATGVGENVWKGDGISNCLSYLWSDKRLQTMLAERDDPETVVKKVYKWTIDLTYMIRDSLRLGVDGMITNYPERVVDVLQEPEFHCLARIATVKDNPWTTFLIPHEEFHHPMLKTSNQTNIGDYLQTFGEVAGSIYRFLNKDTTNKPR